MIRQKSHRHTTRPTNTCKHMNKEKRSEDNLHGLAVGSRNWNSRMVGISGFGGSSTLGSSGLAGRCTFGNVGSSGLGGKFTSGNADSSTLGSSGLGGRCTAGNGGSSTLGSSGLGGRCTAGNGGSSTLGSFGNSGWCSSPLDGAISSSSILPVLLTAMDERSNPMRNTTVFLKAILVDVNGCSS
ncbi:hypothetical protein D1007_30940 [Hordeum vulgare]|nr:hypothetical protein D1007_30940 [Hordeum vulgare]